MGNGPQYFVAWTVDLRTLEPSMAEVVDMCAFCHRLVPTRGHHVVPRCKGGREIVPTCQSCEDFIHKTWTHNQLRDDFNTVDRIRAHERFQKFLKWLLKQPAETSFRSRRNRSRTDHKYR